MVQAMNMHRAFHLQLLKFFTWLAYRFGREVEQGRLLDLRLTHQAISEIIGTT